MSHSKRNTSRAVFTSYERALAKANWSTSSARLTRESFLPLASCSLCLEPAQDPVACPAGDLFCRECAISNILAQKTELRRLARARAHDAQDRAERQAREDAEAQARAVREFELVQAGLSGGGGRGSSNQTPAAAAAPTPTPPAATSAKRKRVLDDDAVQRAADADRAQARRAIEAERAAAHDARALPSFWTPSETTAAAAAAAASSSSRIQDPEDDAASEPLCPAGRERHALSLHALVSVAFTVDAQGQRVCPACNKALSNASRAILAKPCGHVLCRSCVHQFVKPLPGGGGGSGGSSSKSNGGGAVLVDPHAGTTGAVRCYVCEAELEPADAAADHKKKKDKKAKKRDRTVQPGLVALRSEGTGFSAGGASEVKKQGMAFQC